MGRWENVFQSWNFEPSGEMKKSANHGNGNKVPVLKNRTFLNTGRLKQKEICEKSGKIGSQKKGKS